MKMRPAVLKQRLCKAFCGSINVHPVPSGLAISSAFEDQSGDPISFYLTEMEGHYLIEDDGSYLSHLIAKDIPIHQGARGQLLDAILEQGHAYWDRDTLEIRSSPFPESEIPCRIADFMSSLIRVRDLELITREVVRSTFRDDAIRELQKRFGSIISFREDVPINPSFSDFPADMVLRPMDGAPLDARSGAIYFVNTNDKLNEALLLRLEADRLKRNDFEVIAIIDEAHMVSNRRFQRAQNRSLTMPIFRGDEDSAITMIGRTLKLVV